MAQEMPYASKKQLALSCIFYLSSRCIYVQPRVSATPQVSKLGLTAPQTCSFSTTLYSSTMIISDLQ